MLVKQDQISPCEIELEIEIEADKVASAFDDTYIELGKTVAIPGFRKGKAPRAVLQSFLDQERVKRNVADRLIARAYDEAIDETNVEPFRPAGYEIIKFEPGSPMVFKVKVPLAPRIELGQYVDLEIERKVLPVTDEEVQAEIDHLIDDRTPYEPVTDREVKEGDVALVELKRDDEPDKEPAKQTVNVGENLPDFDKGLVGMRIGEEKAIEVTYPEDFGDEELRGRSASVHTKLIEIHARQLPDLTDEWVQRSFLREPKEGEEPDPNPLDTADKLRALLRSALEKAAVANADDEVRARVVDKVVSGSTVCFPEVLVEEAVDRRLAELHESLKKRDVTLDDYLRHTNETLDQVRERFAREFRNLLTTSLVFREIMEKENITVEEDDVKAEIQEMASERRVPVESMTAYVESTDSQDLVNSRVRRKKVVDFLVHASNIKNVGA